MIASLEAILRSTFVMLSQNRADQNRQLLADQQSRTVKDEAKQNEESLALSRQIPAVLRSRDDRAPAPRPVGRR
jgi:uncharacterized membrane protein